MKKRLPKFTSDREVQEFLADDISAHIEAEKLSPMSFEFAAKNKVVNLRMSDGLLGEIKKVSKLRGMPYQRFIREAIEKALKKSGGKSQ